MSSLTVGAHSRPRTDRWTGIRQAWAVVADVAAAAGHAVADRAARARQAVLTITGLGFVDAAAYQVTLGVGLASTGVSLLLLEYLTSEPKTPVAPVPISQR